MIVYGLKQINLCMLKQLYRYCDNFFHRRISYTNVHSAVTVQLVYHTVPSPT